MTNTDDLTKIIINACPCDIRHHPEKYVHLFNFELFAADAHISLITNPNWKAALTEMVRQTVTILGHGKSTRRQSEHYVKSHVRYHPTKVRTINRTSPLEWFNATPLLLPYFKPMTLEQAIEHFKQTRHQCR